MIIIDELNLLKIDDIEINWKLFVDEILNIYFNDSDHLTFIEVGSLDANDSLYFKNKFSNSIVHTIEGLEENYVKYMKNLKNINTYNICIASYNGQIIYHKKNINGIHGIYNRGNIYGDKKILTNCITFDTFCNNNNIKNIDVIKIDIEGATYDLLKSIENNVLNDIKIMHIETENFNFFEGQKLDSDCEKILLNNNFKCIMKTGYFPNPKKNTMQFDSIWINSIHIN